MTLFVTVRFMDLSYDDSFITYRYAHNLASGKGFVFNPGDRYLGITAPLYGLVLGMLGFLFGPDSIPRLSGILTGIAMFVTCAGLLRLTGKYKVLGIGIAASVVYVCNPILHAYFGSEMFAQIALAMWAFVLADDKKYTGAAVLGCFAAMVRPDGLAILPVLAALYVYRERRFPTAPTVASFSILVLAGLASFLYFGTVLPHTIGQKVMEAGVRGEYLPTVFKFLRMYFMDGHVEVTAVWDKAGAVSDRMFYGPMILVLAATGLLYVRSLRFLWPFFAWILLKETVYYEMGAPCTIWYLFPAIFGLSILSGVAVQGIVRSMGRYQTVGLCASGLFLLAVAVKNAPYDLVTGSDWFNGRKATYLAVADWTRRNTPPGSSIAYGEIGFLGYYSDRPLYDPAGIVNDGVVAHLESGDSFWIYRYYRPNVIFVNPIISPSLERSLKAQPWFVRDYRECATIQAGWDPIKAFQRTKSSR